MINGIISILQNTEIRMILILIYLSSEMVKG